MKVNIFVFLLFVSCYVKGQDTLPNSILGVDWFADSIITPEGSIPPDSIVEMMYGDDLILRIESTSHNCIVNQEPMTYLIRTRMCNTCWLAFNILDSNVIGCSTFCQMVYCAKNREGEPSGKHLLELTVLSILNELKRIVVENDKLRLISSDGSELVLK